MSALRRVLERLRPRRSAVLDVLLAAAVTAMVLVDLSSPADAVGVRPTDGWAVLLSLCQTVPLAFRRWAPLPAFLLIVLGVAVYCAMGYEVTDGTLATFVGVYTVAAHDDRRRSLVALGVLAVAMTWYWIARAEPYDPDHARVDRDSRPAVMGDGGVCAGPADVHQPGRGLGRAGPGT